MNVELSCSVETVKQHAHPCEISDILTRFLAWCVCCFFYAKNNILRFMYSILKNLCDWSILTVSLNPGWYSSASRLYDRRGSTLYTLVVRAL